VRTRDEAKRTKILKKKKQRVKNEIILKALAEQDDLVALRQEKQQLALEEKRIRAMRDLEKVGKEPIDASKLQKAQRDERIRQTVEKRELRRQRLTMQAVEEEERRRSVMKARQPPGYE